MSKKKAAKTSPPKTAGRTSKAKSPVYASRGAWKRYSGKRWPPPDNPLLRHDDTEADLALGREAERAHEITLAERRLNALVHTKETAGAPAPTGGAAPVAPVVGASNWTQLGPLAIPNGQTYSAARVLVSGRVTAIAIDPSAPDTIYLGAAQGGIWKTTDNGVHWEAKSDNEVSLAIGALAIDPTPGFQQIVYAGTGEGNFSQDSYYGLGVLKSINGGDTWTNLASGTFAGARFCRIVVAPGAGSSPATLLFAATTFGLYRSTDGGVNWNQLTSGLPLSAMATDVVLDAASNTLYVAFWNNGIYKSTNANAATPTFTQLTSGLPTATAAPPNGVLRIALGISASSPQTVYALMSNNDTNNPPPGPPYNYAVDKFYVTTNGGTSWSSITLPGPVTVGIGGQGFYNLAVNVDPTTPDIVYLSGISLWKAVKSGATWTITNIGGPFHPDNHALAFRPSDHLSLWAGSDGGIYKSIDGGASWDDSLNKGLCIAQCEFIDQHPSSTAVAFTGTQDNGTEQYRGSCVFNHADDGDGGFVVVNQSTPVDVVSTYYLPSPKLSIQGGKFGTWQDVSSGIGGTVSLFYPPVTACRTNPSLLAIGTDVVSIDPSQGTGSWPTQVSLVAGEQISALCFVDANLIYAATVLGKVFKLVGPAWTATQISQAPLPNRYIWDVSPLPGNNNTVIAIMSGFGTGHVWRGAAPATGPATWTDISGNLPDIPVNALVIDPLNANRMFVGTDVGVFETANGGSTWASISAGLPNCAVFDLRLHEATRILRAATHGRGLWEKPADAASTPAVDLYVRDHVMETARVVPAPGNVAATFEDPLRYVALGDAQWWWMCADIKIDALEGVVPSFQMPVSAVDYLAFESKLQHRQPQRSRLNRVYVQLQNRGFQPAASVNVKILWATASAGLPNLPADFWTAFPGDSSNTADWHPVGTAQNIASFKPGIPVVLEWDWTPPATAAEHSCMLVVMDSASDPIPASSKVFDVGVLVPNEKRTGLKNLHVIDPLSSTGGLSTVLGFSRKSGSAQIINVIPHGKTPPKLSLIFSKKAVPGSAAVEGLTIKTPSQSVIRALTKKYGEGMMAGFDTTKLFSLTTRTKPGALTAILGDGAKAIVVIEGASSGEGGTAFLITQVDGKRVVGGSTFAMKTK